MQNDDNDEIVAIDEEYDGFDDAIHTILPTSS